MTTDDEPASAMDAASTVTGGESDPSLCFMDATELARRIRARTVSCVEVMTSFLDQIDLVNPKVNALCTVIDRVEAIEMARRADRAVAREESVGPLHGLPIAIKDALATRGIRTTMGSPLFANHVPDEDAPVVARLRRAGALVIGKTNMPEFGAGSHTFNPIFGATRNPYDLTRSGGGSSGGAAAALAAGMLPIADGSDMGGSLRNPGSFCNVVGFRPSIGRVPGDASGAGWLARLVATGPMGRTVADAALLLSVMAGYDAADPLGIDEPPEVFRRDMTRDFSGTRIGWGGDLGYLPIEPEVMRVCRATLPIFRELGCDVEARYPDFRGAMEVFQTQRALLFGLSAGQLEQSHPDWRDRVKEDLLWNMEKGLGLSAQEIILSDVRRTQIYARVMKFFEGHDFLLLPAAQVLPFDADVAWPRSIAGHAMKTYIDWMEVCCVITLTGLPAISVPGGFSASGLPVGIQIVGQPRADLSVLQLAHAFEQRTRHGRVRPENIM